MTFEQDVLMYHWMGQYVGESTPDELCHTIRTWSPNVTGVVVKSNNGATWQGYYDTKPAMAVNGPDDIARWAEVVKTHGLKFYLWCVLTQDKFSNQIETISRAIGVDGVDAMILDVESGSQYFGQQTPDSVMDFAYELRLEIPDSFHIGLAFDARGDHPTLIHLDRWIPFINSLHPMVYHWHFSEGRRGPGEYLDEAFSVCQSYDHLPVIPVLQAYRDPVSGMRVPQDDIIEAGRYSFQKGAQGVSFYRLGTAGAYEFEAISQIDPAADYSVSLPDQTKTFQVLAKALNTRSEPVIDWRTRLAREQLHRGEIIRVDAASRTEQGGHVWWQHSKGWSAEKTIDGRYVFLKGVDGSVPDVDQERDFTFDRFPLNDIQWLYYYGNTYFAYMYGRNYNYDGYSQGLHGGLDFGNRGAVPVYAGVHGVFDYSGNGRAFRPNRVDVKVGDYTVIYGHVAYPVRLNRGDPVTPDTIVGYIDQTAQHVHLEIRGAGNIYNPLLFMSDEMVDRLIHDHAPVGATRFYSSHRWQRWISPLDQPVIRLGGPVIGPRA